MGAETYDASEEIYFDSRERHFSRFSRIVNAKLVCAGLTVCISSSRTIKDFTQRMKKKAEEDNGIYYSAAPYWVRKPMLNSCGKSFMFDTTTMSVVSAGDKLKEYKALSEKPPMEE